ncbi:RNA polymerase sigma factor [Cohnella hashimotonis]|uniref:Sigma-70 family RNA polymerase sigma factor n=1 Tax=Cohnella hashimotonis TaxID=2826895 RepID=A0ABT6TSU9_9BACL|nr:sigma-70 family RNA polymerase sigma factor [Cohnella hashimotonis]MDI4649933.1 sigma-70 family RNA polymerase sigma factor [Cohnella hashimotonis]
MDIAKAEAQRLYEENAVYIYRLVLMLTKSRALAEDITQDVFMQAFRKYGSFDPQRTGSARPWLSRIAINQTRNSLRKNRWLSLIGHTPERAAPDSIEDVVLSDERDRELWREVLGLSLKTREVVTLHFYGGMTLQETADLLGIPLGTCKSRLHSALNNLRARLPNKDRYFAYGSGGSHE